MINKKKIILVLIITLMLNIIGCKKGQDLFNKSTKYNNSDRFKIVSVQKIDDDEINGINIFILVDKETKIMYMQTEKFYDGYSTALQVMVDTDGKPLIYNDVLN
ncbi:hypothetical protein FDB39_17045 [Clostridium botulinum]|nr:hypothetical protein [Clostridium botulinum]